MESTCGGDQEKLFLFIFEYQAVLSLAFLRFLHNGVSVARRGIPSSANKADEGPEP